MYQMIINFLQNKIVKKQEKYKDNIVIFNIYKKPLTFQMAKVKII